MSKLILEEFLPFRLNRLSAELSTRMHEIYGRQYGIDVPQWRVLATIGALGQATAHQVVLSTRTNKSTISRAVRKLKQAGWIMGSALSQDRRNVALELTPRGKAVHEEITAQVLALEAQVLSHPGLDTAALNAVLDQLENALGMEGS